MSKPVLLATQGLHPDVANAYAEQVEFQYTDETDAVRLTALASAADGVLVRTPLPDGLFDACSRLRVAVRHGVGLDMIPVFRATQAGVPVANVPGANSRTVAEFVMMQTLNLVRQQDAVRRGLTNHQWKAARSRADRAVELHGMTMGIVGYGAIGREAARIAAHGFGMCVLATGRTPPLDDPLAVGVTLQDLLSRSDVVVLACPLTDQTRGMIGSAEFARMKPSAYLVNVARGPVTEEAALIDALLTGRIAGAALDVHHVTPLPTNHPLFDRPGVLITPHLAGITDTAMKRMGMASVSQALDVLAGRKPEHLVNPEVWEQRRR